jgi:uncharacterized protein YjbI with pentapeptide repeats
MRGVVISDELLERLLAAAPRKDDRVMFRAVRFDRATFQDWARFDGVSFQRGAVFRGASFQGGAVFRGASFQGETKFDGVSFQRGAVFEEASFEDWAWFVEASFHGGARFKRATFQGDAVFDRASFHGGAGFSEATFQGDAVFDKVSFQGGAGFIGARFQARAGFTETSFQGWAWFDGASFQDWAGFREASFQGEARFIGAALASEAVFSRATFQDETRFDGATFQGGAVFDRTTFQAWAWFGRATFKGGAVFDRATFQHRAEFGGATVVAEARFSQATFEGEARFDQATFKSPARWDRTTFKHQVAYNGATFHNLASFNGAVFEQARQLGPLLVAWRLELNDVVFHTWVQLEVAAASLHMGRTQFVGGAQIRVRWASVALDDASLAVPSLLAGVPPFRGLDERPFAQRWARRPPERPAAEQQRPRLLTLVRTDAAGLRIANVDLRACRFVEAHNLDKLRIEATPHLALPPSGWHRVGGVGLPVWRWTSRMTLAEEQQWRATRWPRPTRSGRRHPQLRGWYPPACRPAPELPDGSPRWPVQLAALYRELRKGREDAKDEPGAADFYYGECEMRRHNPGTPLAERFVLWLYWLTSGYGLRGLRALACLAVIVLALAGVLHVVGFRPLHPVSPRSYWSSLLYAAESTLSLGTGDVRLTGWGRALRIVLRLTGPVLLGLALLSVRNRVKR